jgi:hypothetical protein
VDAMGGDGKCGTGGMAEDECMCGMQGTGGASGWLKLTLAEAAAVVV